MDVDPNYDPSDFLLAGLPNRGSLTSSRELEPDVGDDSNAQVYGIMDNSGNQDENLQDQVNNSMNRSGRLIGY